eukprot:3471319-Rhodomonas_salina.1
MTSQEHRVAQVAGRGGCGESGVGLVPDVELENQPEHLHRIVHRPLAWRCAASAHATSHNDNRKLLVPRFPVQITRNRRPISCLQSDLLLLLLLLRCARHPACTLSQRSGTRTRRTLLCKAVRACTRCPRSARRRARARGCWAGLICLGPAASTVIDALAAWAARSERLAWRRVWCAGVVVVVARRRAQRLALSLCVSVCLPPSPSLSLSLCLCVWLALCRCLCLSVWCVWHAQAASDPLPPPPQSAPLISTPRLRTRQHQLQSATISGECGALQLISRRLTSCVRAH